MIPNPTRVALLDDWQHVARASADWERLDVQLDIFDRPFADEAEAADIRAGLDVFDVEPLPPGDPWRTAPGTVLTPHIGYGSTDTFRQFYGESLENIEAYLRDAPIRMMNPQALDHPRQRALSS